MLQTTLETAYKTVKKLVEDFQGNKDYYLASSYKEDSAQHAFIDKFFIALGWDVNHETDKNPYEQEARTQTNVNVQGRKKRADYAFYLAPNFRDVRFYAEAKKPSVQIENADDYFQTIRYGYSSETPLAILTNFERFHILDCRYAPSIETALARFVKKYTYEDYLNKEKFAEIYYLFSREAVAGGSIEKRALELPKARGGAVQLGLFKGAYKPIDEALLDDLDEYRNTLAHAFKNGKPDLDHWALTEIVQRVIDRLVFIRFLEDKLIEPEDIISNFGTKSESVWKDFVSTCRKLDKVYNGAIYKKHDILDAPDFKFDENVFADICEKLSSKNTPYDFDKIPIHILGSIYERFLGKVITATAKRAKVEEKPEVKKAGGVFYTPEYIVRYIVENTIGKLIKGKSPDEISAMRFADIACGSGSFLLGAYDCLLRYHASYYNKNPKETTERDCIERDGALLLTLHKKREILLNNIYGVDIDQQAVEVSQLSLYLKLLENETLGSTAASLRAEAGETVLPPLNKNILCGNSLIGQDFYEGVQEEMALYENKKEEVREVNPFDWEARFPDIMRNGGFDAVIGNPPYGAEFSNAESEYLKKNFTTFIWRGESYLIFSEKAVRLLKTNGIIGFITPDTLLNLGFTQALRRFLLSNTRMREIVTLPSCVFPEATVDTILLFAEKLIAKTSFNDSPVHIKVFNKKQSIQDVKSPAREFSIKTKQWFEQNAFNTSSDGKELQIISKVEKSFKCLSDFAEMFYGIKAYQIGKGKPPQTKDVLEKKPFTAMIRNSKDFLPFYDGKHIGRYQLFWNKDNWLKYGSWLAEPRQPGKYEGEKILVRKIIGETLIATYIQETSYCNTLLFVIKTKKEEIEYLYLLGILNSHFIGWFFRKKFQINADDTFPQIMIRDVLQFPIPISDKSHHSEIISLVTSMLSLHAQLPHARTDFDKERLARQIESADRRIDELVYELYGLTAEEIKIVEGSFKEGKR